MQRFLELRLGGDTVAELAKLRDAAGVYELAAPLLGVLFICGIRDTEHVQLFPWGLRSVCLL